MSYAGIEVPITGPGGAKSVETPVASAIDCGSPLVLQQMLGDLGYYGGEVTGFFNANTFSALERFAADVGAEYTPGFYPNDVHCGAIIAAWTNRRIGKDPFPKPGVPAVMPSFTPDQAVPRIQKTLAALAKQKPACPSCSPCAVPGFSGFLGLGAFGLGAFGTQPTIGQGKPANPAATKLWQTFLGQVIEPAPKVDGVFGSGTTSATKAFQKGAGLTADGIVGPTTWTRADAVAASLAAPAAPPGGGAPVVVPPPGSETTAVVSATNGGGGPLANAKIWWGEQTKTTQYAVMGGGAVALIGLLMLATRSGEEAA
jgi:peptidoglycan hydrolase-like protein with peptidoglycan-binding domain